MNSTQVPEQRQIGKTPRRYPDPSPLSVQNFPEEEEEEEEERKKCIQRKRAKLLGSKKIKSKRTTLLVSIKLPGEKCEEKVPKPTDTIGKFEWDTRLDAFMPSLSSTSRYAQQRSSAQVFTWENSLTNATASPFACELLHKQESYGFLSGEENMIDERLKATDLGDASLDHHPPTRRARTLPIVSLPPITYSFNFRTQTVKHDNSMFFAKLKISGSNGLTELVDGCVRNGVVFRSVTVITFL